MRACRYAQEVAFFIAAVGGSKWYMSREGTAANEGSVENPNRQAPVRPACVLGEAGGKSGGNASVVWQVRVQW